MNLSYYDTRALMCKVVKMMFDRRLTNVAGGNMAVRVDENRILITPSMMSEWHFCELEPKDILLIDYDEKILEGDGPLSRETAMHVNILSRFENIGATIHAHPFWCMPYVSAGLPIPNVTEATMGRGKVECVQWTKAFTRELANNVLEYYEARRELAERKPIACILTSHGVFVSGKTLYNAYSMLERIESDALCGIMRPFVEKAQELDTL